MKLRACGLIVALGVAAASHGEEATTTIKGLRLTQIGDTSAIRLDWTVEGTEACDYNYDYEIKRVSIATSEAEVIGHTSHIPATKVFLDDGPKVDGGTYRYYVKALLKPSEKASVEATAEIKLEPSTSRLLRHALFDDGRLNATFESRLIEGPDHAHPTFAIEKGRLEWLPTNSYKSSRLILGEKNEKPTQILARIAVRTCSDAAVPKTAKVGVGLCSDDERNTYSLVLTQGDGDPLQVRLIKEPTADGSRGASLLGEPLQTVEVTKSSCPPSDFSTWVWLRLGIVDNELRARAWLDGKGEKSGESLSIGDERIDLADWGDGKVVLIGGESGMTASFGEIYIEDLAGPPALVENTPRSEQGVPSTSTAPVAQAPAPAAPVEDSKREEFKELWKKGFDGLPTVIRLVRRGSLPPEQSLNGDDVADYLEECDTEARAFDFASPARFTIPRFDMQGAEFEDDGAVIYEGMRFVVDGSGNYEVRFLVSTPAMPVMLRLQLHFPCPKWGDHTITLPPIELPPYTNAKGHFEAATWKVRHVGHSPILTRHERNPDEHWLGALVKRKLGVDPSSLDSHLPAEALDQPIAIRRSGTARFGSMPEPAN